MTNTQTLLKETILPTAMMEYDGSADRATFFEFFAAQQVLKTYSLNEEEINQGLVGDKLDGGCDGCYVFCNDTLITSDLVDLIEVPRNVRIDVFVLQAKETMGFGEDVINKLKSLSANLLALNADFLNFNGRYNEDVLNSFDVFRRVYRRAIVRQVNLTFHYEYVTLGIDVHENVKAQAIELKEVVQGKFPDAVVEFDFVGADDLLRMYNRTESTIVNLPLATNAIGVGKASDYVALVYLKDYYAFVADDNDQIRKVLFEANVRDYQGSNKVNKSIQKTLENNSGDNFWWLNNGVTILAQHVSLVSNMELQLDEPRIVNGMQTSTEIFSFFSRNKDKLDAENRAVLVRVIVPKSEESRDRIIYATNNQTPVPPSSLRVTDPIHLQIETFFKNRGLFYDRRKNYYKNQGKRISEIVSISFLGQCMISIFLQKPDYARARPSTVLADEELYLKLYNDSIPLESYFRCAQIGKRISECLWRDENLSKAQRTNIFFYVIYAVVAVLLKKEKIYPHEIINVNVVEITDAFVMEIIGCVLQLFIAAGGSDKIAKGPEFKKHLIQALVEKYNVQSYSII